MRPLLLLPMLLLAGLASAPLHAQGAIHRCVDATGRPVFTDRRCRDLDATAVLPAPAASSGATGTSPAASAEPRRCATDPAMLRQQVVDAFARREPNRLAGLILWDDYGEAEAVAQIQVLAALVVRPLLDLREDGDAADATANASIYDASQPLRDMLDTPSPAPSPPSDAAPVDALTAVTGGEDGSREETRFAVEPRAGCLWLLPPSG